MSFRSKWFALLLTCTAYNVYGAPNQQVSFNRVDHQQYVTYDYTWYDHNNTLQHISFNLNKKTYRSLPSSQINYKIQGVNQFIKRDLMRLASRIDPRRARVNVNQVGKEIRVSFRGEDQQFLALLNEEFNHQRDLTFSLYLKQHYYEVFTTASGQTGVKADHIRYINEFSAVLEPVAKAFYKNLKDQATNRNYINLILSWAQSIPYNTLTGRGEANGSGFLPPTSLLDANLGDCDSKSVLVAALIRNHMPVADFKLLLLPKHALLAINIPHEESDIDLPGEGEKLIALEPTGPAALKAGELGDASIRSIERGLVTYQTIPPTQ